MYIGRLTRLEVLFPISYLATKSSHLNVYPFKKGNDRYFICFVKRKMDYVSQEN